MSLINHAHEFLALRECKHLTLVSFVLSNVLLLIRTEETNSNKKRRRKFISSRYLCNYVWLRWLMNSRLSQTFSLSHIICSNCNLFRSERNVSSFCGACLPPSSHMFRIYVTLWRFIPPSCELLRFSLAPIKAFVPLFSCWWSCLLSVTGMINQSFGLTFARDIHIQIETVFRVIRKHRLHATQLS